MRRLKELANSALPDAIAAGDVSKVEHILAAHLGDGVGLAVLGIDPAALGAPLAMETPH